MVGKKYVGESLGMVEDFWTVVCIVVSLGTCVVEANITVDGRSVITVDFTSVVVGTKLVVSLFTVDSTFAVSLNIFNTSTQILVYMMR